MYPIFDHCLSLILFQFFYIYCILSDRDQNCTCVQVMGKAWTYREAEQRPLFYSLLFFLSKSKIRFLLHCCSEFSWFFCLDLPSRQIFLFSTSPPTLSYGLSIFQFLLQAISSSIWTTNSSIKPDKLDSCHFQSPIKSFANSDLWATNATFLSSKTTWEKQVLLEKYRNISKPKNS